MKYLSLLLLILVIGGCARTPLTEEEQFEREYAEADRKNLYVMWEKQCIEAGWVIYSYNPTKVCRRKGCIPSRWDWKYDSKRERPALGNSVICVSPRQLREIFR